MLSKKERLKRVDFNHFFSLGRRLHHPLLTLIYAPHAGVHGSVVVSKKIAQKAVVRNTIRRRIYDILRHQFYAGAPKGVYIVLVKKGALTASHTELADALVSLIRKVEV